MSVRVGVDSSTTAPRPPGPPQADPPDADRAFVEGLVGELAGLHTADAVVRTLQRCRERLLLAGVDDAQRARAMARSVLWHPSVLGRSPGA